MWHGPCNPSLFGLITETYCVITQTRLLDFTHRNMDCEGKYKRDTNKEFWTVTTKKLACINQQMMHMYMLSGAN